MDDNKKALEEGGRKMHAIVSGYLIDRISEIGINLLNDAVLSAKYHNLTGNTLTSLAVGIYSDGVLRRIISAVTTNGLKNPTRKKLYRGDGLGVVMVEDYDNGRIVPVKKYPLIETDGEYGLTTSKNFLSSYKPDKKSIGLVMCTGTEYSDFLESVKGLNVLSDTMDYVESISRKTFKPMRQ